MSDNLKHRIKHPIEEPSSPLKDFPKDIKDKLIKSKVIESNDYNLGNHTCAYLAKLPLTVGEGSNISAKSVYLCYFKAIIKDPRIKVNDSSNKFPDEDSFIVNGSQSLDKGPEEFKTAFWHNDAFICRYFDYKTGKAVTHEKSQECGSSTQLHCAMCNCYAPRGGLGAGFDFVSFEGAIKHVGMFDSNPDPTEQTLDLYDEMVKYSEEGKVRQQYKGILIAKTTPKNKLPSEPNRLSYLYMM